MVAGLFHEAGYYMGPDIMPPLRGNPKGMFESRAVNMTNERLMAEHVSLRPKHRLGKLLHYRRLAGSQCGAQARDGTHRYLWA